MRKFLLATILFSSFNVGAFAAVNLNTATVEQSLIIVRKMAISKLKPIKKARLSRAFLLAKFYDHLTRIPASAPASGDKINGPPRSSLAASTMPSDIPNFILRGARLATMTVKRPTNVAGS